MSSTKINPEQVRAAAENMELQLTCPAFRTYNSKVNPDTFVEEYTKFIISKVKQIDQIYHRYFLITRATMRDFYGTAHRR